MGKCLVTRLNGVVNNDKLPIWGGFKVKFDKVNQPTAYTQSIGIVTNKPTTLKIVGEGYFTDSSLTNNIGKEITIGDGGNSKIFVSNDGVTLLVCNKYDITILKDWEQSLSYPSKRGLNKHLNLEDLKYSDSLSVVDFQGQGVSGDISALENLSILQLYLDSKNITGDIKSIGKISTLNTFELRGSSVTGDISALANLKNLTKFSNYGTVLYGNISAFSGLSKLTSFELFASALNRITGDIGTLSNLPQLNKIDITYSNITGDVANMPSSFSLLALHSNTGTLTWSSRPSSANIISLKDGIRFNNIDKMLQDQANCQVPSISTKIIDVLGTRTSASDAAVTTLQQKGYTVIVNS